LKIIIFLHRKMYRNTNTYMHRSSEIRFENFAERAIIKSILKNKTNAVRLPNKKLNDFFANRQELNKKEFKPTLKNIYELKKTPIPVKNPRRSYYACKQGKLL
jgi:hypothetical protein